MNPMRRMNPMIGQLTRRIALSSERSKVSEGFFESEQKPVRLMWAHITGFKGSLFGQSDYSTNDGPSHSICIRNFVDLDLTNSAWVYEHRSMSPDLWYKVLNTNESEDGQFVWITARLVKREEDNSWLSKSPDIEV